MNRTALDNLAITWKRTLGAGLIVFEGDKSAWIKASELESKLGLSGDAKAAVQAKIDEASKTPGAYVFRDGSTYKIRVKPEEFVSYSHYGTKSAVR